MLPSNYGFSRILFELPFRGELAVTLKAFAFCCSGKRASLDDVTEVLDNTPIRDDILQECLQIKRLEEARADRMSLIYRMFMYSASIFFHSVPLMKLYLSEDRRDLTKFLLFPCVFPFPLSLPYSYTVAYGSQVLCSTMSFVLFTRFVHSLQCPILIHG